MDTSALQPQEFLIGNIKGYDPQVEVLEDTPEVYRLKITKRLDGMIHEITTPNLRGGITQLENVLPHFEEAEAEKDTRMLQIGSYLHTQSGWMPIRFSKLFQRPPIIFTFVQGVDNVSNYWYATTQNITVEGFDARLAYVVPGATAYIYDGTGYTVNWMAISERRLSR